MGLRDRLVGGGEVGGDPGRGRRPTFGVGLGEHDVDDRHRDALGERRRHPFGSQQQPSQGHAVLGHRRGALVDRDLRPRHPSDGFGGERQVPLSQKLRNERRRPAQVSNAGA